MVVRSGAEVRQERVRNGVTCAGRRGHCDVRRCVPGRVTDPVYRAERRCEGRNANLVRCRVIQEAVNGEVRKCVTGGKPCSLNRTCNVQNGAECNEKTYPAGSRTGDDPEDEKESDPGPEVQKRGKPGSE